MRLLSIALALPLLVACGADSRVGALPSDHDGLPVVVITWCGDDGPAQVDASETNISLHYRAKRAFDGGEVELDLADPGPDWEVVEGVVSGGRKSGRVPTLDISLVVVTASSQATTGDRAGNGDLGKVEFTTKWLREAGAGTVYVHGEGNEKDQQVPRGEFTLDC